MPRLKLEATNLPSIERAMNQFPQILDEQLGESLRSGMEFAKAKAVKLAPRGRGEAKGKRLWQTIYTRVARKGRRGWSATLGANAPHARIREQGGTIRAKNKPYLVFMGRDGHLVRVKQVTQKATPYLRPALQQTRADVTRELDKGMKQVATTIRRIAN